MIVTRNVHVLFERRRRARARRHRISGAVIGGEPVLFEGREHIAALQDINVSIETGSRVALIGQNGAGKTTFLRTIAGVYEPQIGSVSVTGKIATLFSNAVALSDFETGRENLGLSALLRSIPPEKTRNHLEEIVKETGLEDYLDKPITHYSEGMRTRLGIAMVTLADPDILLLDEALNASDMHFIQTMRSRISAFNSPAGIVVIASHSHDLLSQLCDRAIWLSHGRVRKQGGFEEVSGAFLEHSK